MASWKAFLRRIKEVREYRGIGKVITYNSVKEYFNRDTEFGDVSDMSEIPF